MNNDLGGSNFMTQRLPQVEGARIIASGAIMIWPTILVWYYVSHISGQYRIWFYLKTRIQWFKTINGNGFIKILRQRNISYWKGFRDDFQSCLLIGLSILTLIGREVNINLKTRLILYSNSSPNLHRANREILHYNRHKMNIISFSKT